jgi:hypothetical protein
VKRLLLWVALPVAAAGLLALALHRPPAAGEPPPAGEPAGAAEPDTPPPPDNGAGPEEPTPHQPPVVPGLVLDSFGTSHRPICGEGWYSNDLPAAEQRARTRGVPLLVIFEAEDCTHCRKFNREYLADPSLAAVFTEPGLEIVKKFYDDEEARTYQIRASPTFFAYVLSGTDRRELVDWMPGLLEPELLRKRIADIRRGRGRLARQRRRLAQDPRDVDALKVILDEYLPLLSAAEQVRLAERALALDPDWIHGVALYIYVLRQAEPVLEGARERLDALAAQARSSIEAGTGTARDEFTLGYALLCTDQIEPGVAHLRASTELDPTECEVRCHLAFGLAHLAGRQKQAGDPEAARQSFIAAYDQVRKALGYCPRFPMAQSRKRWLDLQYRALFQTETGEH